MKTVFSILFSFSSGKDIEVINVVKQVTSFTMRYKDTFVYCSSDNVNSLSKTGLQGFLRSSVIKTVTEQ